MRAEVLQAEADELDGGRVGAHHSVLRHWRGLAGYLSCHLAREQQLLVKQYWRIFYSSSVFESSLPRSTQHPVNKKINNIDPHTEFCRFVFNLSQSRPASVCSTLNLQSIFTWVTVCLPPVSPFSLSGLYGGIGGGEARLLVSPGPRVEYTR